MFQNLDPNVMIQSILVLFLGFFMYRFTRILEEAVKKDKAEPKALNVNEAGAEHVKIIEPKQPIGSVLGDIPILNNNKKITLEIEFPDLPEKIKIPYEKLPLLFKLIRNEKEEHVVLVKNKEELEQVLGPREKEETKEQEKKNEVGTVSFMQHHDKPWLDIISKVSGLEFSEDGEKVYCPRHGWVSFIVTSDGRILCGEGYETLWDPNRDRYKPPSKQELIKLQQELSRVSEEIEELRNMAQFTPMQQIRKQNQQEELEEAEEEPIEEYEEE